MPARARKKKKRAKDKDMPTAVIYTRVSSAEQVKNYSLETQEDDCKNLAKKNGWKVLEVFREEGKSAKTMDRPMMNALMDYCRENEDKVGYVIVKRMDRFSRCEAEAAAPLLELERALHIKIRSVSEPHIDETPIGRYMRTMQLASSELSNGLRREQAYTGMRRGLKHGYWQWQPPVGYETRYSDDGEPLPMVPSEEAQYIQRAFQLMKTGNYSQAELRRILKREGFEVCPSQMTRILTRKLYTGWIEHEWLDEPILGKHEPIISVEDFDSVKRVLERDTRKTWSHQKIRSDLPLRGVLICTRCGKKMTGSFPKSRGKPYGYYHCVGSGCRSVPVKVAEEEYVRLLERLEPKNEYLELFSQVAKGVWQERVATSEEIKARLIKDLKKLRERKKRLLDKHLDGTVCGEDYIEENKRIREAITEREDALERVSLETGEIDDFIRYSVDCFRNLSNQWKSGDITVKTRLNHLIFPNGVLVTENGFRITDTSLVLDLLSPKKATKLRMVLLHEVEAGCAPSYRPRDHQDAQPAVHLE